MDCCCNALTVSSPAAAASLARKVYMRQGMGIGAFRKHYGGRNKRKGAVPEHFAKASGGLIRHMLIQLEEQVRHAGTSKAGCQWRQWQQQRTVSCGRLAIAGSSVTGFAAIGAASC